jgi:uncharacterized protein (DUF885 family)
MAKPFFPCWLLLCVGAIATATSAASTITIAAPDLADIPPNAQRIAPLIERFVADSASIEHTHDITASPQREAALRALDRSWLDALAGIEFATLSMEDKIDYALFKRELAYRLQQLDFERARYAEAAPLLPQVDSLIALAEARRELSYADPSTSADTLEVAEKALASLHRKLDEDIASGPIASAAVAYRAAKLLDGVRSNLKDWYAFYDGYDPAFTRRVKRPYEALDKEMEAYAKLLRDQLAGASNPETIIGDPVGRDALTAALRHELIPYSPEEIMALAERELSWSQNEMAKAARQMGYDDWHAALEAIKRQSPAAGEQPRLVTQLADEAIDYVVANGLVTVPELAKRDWRMAMLSPEAQLQAPFFLGGEDVWVAYPHTSMPEDKKQMALRGNNRYFSRAVVFHELIPGHHLQYFYGQRYQTQRQLFDTPFWTEGWALYWEMALYDRGFARTPEEKLGMLFWRSHRAARILFSLSFHLGTMTPQQAVDLLVSRVGHERENAAAEVRRSFAGDYGPLYQAAYLLGGLQFRALHRETVESGKMGERQFHDAILEGGPMPVSLVRSRLLGVAPNEELSADWRFYPDLP